MKILQVIDSLPSTSGGSRFVVNLCRKLSEKGIEVELLLIDGKNSHFLEELLNQNIKVYSLGVNTNRFHPKYIKLVSNYLDKYDLVHVHIFPTSYIVALASLINKNAAPIVFSEHNSFNKRASNSIFKYVEKFIYSRFNKVIAVGPEVEDFVIKHLDVDKNKLITVVNGIDIQRMDLQPGISRESLKVSENDILVLMAARFSTQKDYQTLIRAFIHLPSQFKLIMCGDGPERPACEMLVKELKFENRALFLGNRSDIYSIIKTVDIAVLSSYFEGLPLSVLEYMAAKKPVVATNVEGMNKLVKGAGVLFKVGNDKELAEEILKLGMDSAYYDDVSQKCYDRVQKYSLDVMVENYIDEYEKVLNNKNEA
ncbi:glycosyltransferase family 1 protein [Moraxella osloensis]|uniref:Glycosyltransferase family 1 protein n=1 Tax=Faucicola osloensis TaxID=34062 RepID=A0AAW6TAV0_FAUOS|nr:glycosyltransferase [Moraxella osloensis]MDI4509531.1 glycosyltransferase family 1 protein [Moraxella osloensis]